MKSETFDQKTLTHGLKNFGYSTAEAIADIIDNSIEANAKNIEILPSMKGIPLAVTMTAPSSIVSWLCLRGRFSQRVASGHHPPPPHPPCADYTLVKWVHQLGGGEKSSAPGVESCTRGLLATAEGRLRLLTFP